MKCMKLLTAVVRRIHQRERERVTYQCRISYRNIYLRFTFAMRNCTSTLWIAFRAWKLLRSAFQILFWFQFGIVLVHNYYLEPPEQRSKTTMRGYISWLLFLNYSREKNTAERGRKCERHKKKKWLMLKWSLISELGVALFTRSGFGNFIDVSGSNNHYHETAFLRFITCQRVHCSISFSVHGASTSRNHHQHHQQQHQHHRYY